MIPNTCLRVSEIIGCKRALWLKQHDYTCLPVHPLALAGTELHKHIEEYLKDEREYDFKYPDNEYKFKNFKRFFEGININSLSHANEVRLYAKNYNPIFSGKYDLLLDKMLIDFKSAKFYQAKYTLQLSGYKMLADLNGLNIHSYGVLLLGNYNPELIVINPNTDKFMREYQTAVEAINNPELPEPEWGYLCQFCSYIHHCRRNIKELESEGK